MAAARNKVPPIGSAQWILDERHQSNDLVDQELEDFGFSIRNELEWLNEHMVDIFAQGGQNNLDVYKTPGKLRGKTPRTARKKNPVAARQPLGDLFAPNLQKKSSPAQNSLHKNLQQNLGKTKFHIAEDTENVVPTQSPVLKSPVPRPLFSKALGKGKENQDSGYHASTSEDEVMTDRPKLSTVPVQWSPAPSTQNTIPDTQEATQIFTQEQTQSTQATQRSTQQVSDDERRDTGESFVSAKEAFPSKHASRENLRNEHDEDEIAIDDKPEETQSDAQGTVIRHEPSDIHDTTAINHSRPESSKQTRVTSEQYSISVETQDALDTATRQDASVIPAFPQPPKSNKLVSEQYSVSAETQAAVDTAARQDDTVVHHDIDDQIDLDDDVRSPSDGSSPVKPLVRKSSLTFAALPAREPLIPKKSMGNCVSRTSHVDQNKARGSQLGRFTGGKSLGGSQYAQVAEAYQHDAMNLDEERPELRREESETPKLHNKTSTQRLHERINMLKQKNEPPKSISQNIASQPTQSQSLLSSQPSQPSQPAYPQLPSEQEKDEDDDWISPVRTTVSATNPGRPVLSKSYSADTRPTMTKEPVLPKPISVSNPNPDLSTVVESTTPAGSPTSKKYMDGPLSASKAKFYSALRAAKEKIIGSSAASAQVKLDALAEGPIRPKLQTQGSSEDIFSAKRSDKAGASIFSHLRSPSKESVKTTKSTKITTMPGSPTKDDGRRTRSSSERERQKEREVREKEAKQKQRAEERLKEMREREQSKATAHYQKTKAAAKTPVSVPQANARVNIATTAKTPVPVLQQPQSRLGTTKTNPTTSQKEPEASADEMPPPPPPKSLLPTGPGHKLREPKRLAKAPSKDTLPKAKPQVIKVNLNRFGQAPLAAPKTAPQAAKPAQPAPKPAPTATAKPGPAPKPVPPAPKSAPRVNRPQPPKAAEKPKMAPTQPRADLGTTRPVSRMQTVQDVNRINVPAVNPAKPAKRPFQPEQDESLHRPAKRPSQQSKSKPVTPAHAQFAQGKIPFAEPPQQPQYPNGEDIKLPEIMTDSEDEDSEDEFQQPSWVDTPNLRDLLTQQQLVDPETIFGPIAPLNMEQVFPNKERQKRFRERTSSAYWTNDQVTAEERRKEREARERLARDGAWTYHPSPAPAK
ncbi:hypothetical protein K469DRAFT_652486 [Zopfia rhizophila CBS 207.26]|uniref:Inner centromere protein ARK-binding domain-containing protein n=1 Tax=Zopfia rhizophila CBS 207.26 TaxID=1314779 RepID=A0A6A6EVC1_9PEZI|nr:hypothetical protein K469DRAFT_652486 [Zopfia rhizophila CBS 207.26]